MNLEYKSHKSKKSSVILSDYILIFMVFLLAVVQFIFPVANTQDKVITAFDALKYSNIHWSFDYFILMAITILSAIVLCILHFKKDISYWYDICFWILIFIGILIFRLALLDYLKANPQSVILENPDGTAISLTIIILCILISIVGKIRQVEKLPEKIISSEEFKSTISGKEIIYENTVLLNPKWNYMIGKNPDPLRMVVTNKEIIISSNPLIIIPLESIKSVKFSMFSEVFLFSFVPTIILCKNGVKYKIVWGHPNKAALFSDIENKNIYDNLNKILKGERAEKILLSDVSDKSKYLWSILYLVLSILGNDIMGLGGILAGIFISFGIQKTCIRKDLSKTKKFIYSILYVFGGVAVGFIVEFISVNALGLINK